MSRFLFAALLATALPAAAAKPLAAADQPERAADPLDRVICKRLPVTGSLISTVRQCATKREWDRARESLRSMSAINSCSLNTAGADGVCGTGGTSGGHLNGVAY